MYIFGYYYSTLKVMQIIVKFILKCISFLFNRAQVKATILDHIKHYIVSLESNACIHIVSIF